MSFRLQIIYETQRFARGVWWVLFRQSNLCSCWKCSHCLACLGLGPVLGRVYERSGFVSVLHLSWGKNASGPCVFRDIENVSRNFQPKIKFWFTFFVLGQLSWTHFSKPKMTKLLSTVSQNIGTKHRTCHLEQRLFLWNLWQSAKLSRWGLSLGQLEIGCWNRPTNCLKLFLELSSAYMKWKLARKKQ